MPLNNSDLLLYIVTDRTWLQGKSLYKQVEYAIQGGATFIQLREKDVSFDEFIYSGKLIREIATRYKVPFVVNDNIQVAVDCDADGIHIGQNDISIGEARKILGKNKIIGVSVSTLDEAIAAEIGGADYLGVGAVFNTTTKNDAKSVSLELIKKISGGVNIPVVAIGGINENNIKKLSGTGIAGVAIVSAIFSKSDIKKASTDLLAQGKRWLLNEKICNI